LSFLDDVGFKIYNLISSTVSETQTITAEIEFPYSGYIYALTQDTIKKYKDEETAPVIWGQSEDFRNAKSLAIAFNIYVINSKNEVLSFSAGKKNDFKVTGLENGFSDAVKIVADVDLKNIYIADKGNKSIVVLDNKGVLLKQFKTENDEVWNDIKSITVSPDEKSLFVLSGSKIFVVNL
jgi:DNA-binding beta-propeller fold protein YncE